MNAYVHSVTCASWLVQGGVPLLEASKLPGHSIIAMTERYVRLGPKNLMAAPSVPVPVTIRPRELESSRMGYR